MRGRRRWQVGLWAIALGTFASCSRCGKAGSAAVPLEAMLPRHSVGVLIAPNAATAGEKVRVLEGLKVASFVAQLQGFGDAHGWSDALFAQLGFDVRSAPALEKAGLDPARGLAVAMTLEGFPFLVLPVKDEARLKDTLTHLAASRFGATVASDEPSGERVVHRLAPPGQPPRLGWVVAKGWALVATEGAVKRLGPWAAAPEGGGLAGDPAWKLALARLPPSPDLVGWVPPGSPLLKSQVGAGAVALTLTPAGLAITADAAWKGDPQLLQALAKQPVGLDALGLLPDDAFLVARFTGDASKLGPVAQLLLGPYLSRAFEESGLDLEGQVLANLKPGAVAALSLSPNANLASGVPQLDLKQHQPLRLRPPHRHGGGEGRLAHDPHAQAARRRGAPLRRHHEEQEHDGQTVFAHPYSAGEGVHFAPKGDRVFFASPMHRLKALLAATPGKGPLADPALRTALDAAPPPWWWTCAGCPTRCARSRRPPGASAASPSRQTTLRWLDATDDLTAVTLGLGAKDGTLQRAAAALAQAGGGGPRGSGRRGEVSEPMVRRPA